MALRPGNYTRRVRKPSTWRTPEPERDGAGRVRTHEAAAALAACATVPARMGQIGIRVNACEGFAPYNRQRQKWGKARFKEFAQTYGGDLSRGVGARVRGAAWCYAFAEWAAAKAAEYGDLGTAEIAAKLFARAANEDDKARALAAYERREREGKTQDELDLSKALNVDDI